MRAPEFARIVQDDFGPGEHDRIERALARLKGMLGTPDRHAIQEATHELNDATRHLAEVRMNRSVQAALSGRSIDQL
jgi:hypothetical protein